MRVSGKAAQNRQSALPDFAFPSRDMKFERERQAGYLFDAALPDNHPHGGAH